VHGLFNQIAPSQIFSRMRYGVFVRRPSIYILIVLSTLAACYFYRLRTEFIFACQATGYSSDRYLAYCEATNYGDYEHGAFWFNQEPEAKSLAAKADVLFLGNSRTQFALSTTATARWFSSTSASYYLLGFIGWENSIFARALLQKIKPRAKVYVINIDGFFQPTEAAIGKTVLHDDTMETRYETKHFLQFVHRAICEKLTVVCGNRLVIFRSRQNGMYYMSDRELSKFKGSRRSVSFDQQIDQKEIDDAIAIGRVFLSELPVKAECVILTAIPYVGTKITVANAIASGLGKKLTGPQLDGLQTFDGFHLDPPSAERWSEAFLRTAGPQIQKCLEQSE
jgi:hypothetical protein